MWTRVKLTMMSWDDLLNNTQPPGISSSSLKERQVDTAAGTDNTVNTKGRHRGHHEVMGQMVDTGLILPVVSR
jgi:hypothetical protein